MGGRRKRVRGEYRVCRIFDFIEPGVQRARR